MHGCPRPTTRTTPRATEPRSLERFLGKGSACSPWRPPGQDGRLTPPALSDTLVRSGIGLLASLLLLSGPGSVRKASAASTTPFISFDTLVVIYSNTYYGPTTSAEIDRIQQDMDNVRLFYWRNSRCTVNLAWDRSRVIQISRYVSDTD